MINRQKLCLIALVSAALILMQVSIIDAAPFAYITCSDFGGTVSVIDTATNNVIAIVPVGINPCGVAVTPDGTKVYVVNSGNYSVYDNYSVHDNTVSVIDTATNNVTTNVTVGDGLLGIAVTPDGKSAYVTNSGYYGVPGNTVSVINTSTNTVTATVSEGDRPYGVAVTPLQSLQMEKRSM